MAPKFKKNPATFLDDMIRKPTPKATQHEAITKQIGSLDDEIKSLQSRRDSLSGTDKSSAEIAGLNAQINNKEKLKSELSRQQVELSPNANDRQLRTTTVVAGGALAAGGGLMALKNAAGSPTGNKPPGSPSAPTTPPPTSPASPAPALPNNDGSVRADATQDSQNQRNTALEMSRDVIKHNQSLTSPGYLDEVQRDRVKNAMLLGGPGEALTSAQTSEAIAAQQALGFDNNATERFKNLVEWEARERGDIRNQQTEMLKSGLGLASDYIRSKYAMQGQVMGAMAQGLSGLYSNYNQVAPARTEFSPGLSTAEPIVVSRNTNLIRGFS